MATLTIGGKTVFTQSGTDEPVLSSDITGTLGSAVVFPAGHVIQVKSAIRNTEWQGPDTVNANHTLFATDTSTTTAHTNTAFKVEITPASSASKFFVQYAINIGNESSGISLKLHRGIATSPIYGSSGSRTAQSSSKEWTGDSNQSSQTYYSILDEPATDSTLTYYCLLYTSPSPRD